MLHKNGKISSKIPSKIYLKIPYFPFSQISAKC